MPKVYQILVDGKPCTMTNTQGMTKDEAAKYYAETKGGPDWLRNIFGGGL